MCPPIRSRGPYWIQVTRDFSNWIGLEVAINTWGFIEFVDHAADLQPHGLNRAQRFE